MEMLQGWLEPMWIGTGVAVLAAVTYFLLSWRFVGDTELVVVTKNIAFRGLSGANAIAFNGEAGYQAEFLTAGVYFYPLFFYSITRQPRAQVPPKEIGLVFAQVGAEAPAGARTVKDVGGPELFCDLAAWIEKGGIKGIQRQVLPPGTTLAVHPVAFLIITRTAVFGLPIDPELRELQRKGQLTPQAFGIDPDGLRQVEIKTIEDKEGVVRDAVGVIYTRDGAPLPAGAMAGRLGGFSDFETEEGQEIDNLERVERILRDQLGKHNSFQDFQKFIEAGGSNGMQFDVVRPGTYNFNPVCVQVERVPMLEVSQGQVAVIKAYEGLATLDISGAAFKFGSLVLPGHKGVWADNQTSAHELDKDLKSIHAKSKDGFDFSVGLVVQIHIPDTLAPRVISAVGTVSSLVNDVLQAAVGNYVRDTIQSMQAVDFIERRNEVQEKARESITERLKAYDVECVNVLIQDVKYPEGLTTVLQERTIAQERKTTFEMQRQSEECRIQFEKQKGLADMQAALAKAELGVTIAEQEATAQGHRAKGEASLILEKGKAEAQSAEAMGLAKAKGYSAQVEAIGQTATALTNVASVLGENNVKLMPEILTVGGENGFGGLIGAVTRAIADQDPEARTKAAQATGSGALSA